MIKTFEYELYWDGQPIGRLVKAEPDVPYVEGAWLSNGSDAALRFGAVLSDVFGREENVHWSKSPQIELVHQNGHRSKGYVTGFGNEGMFIRW